MRTARVFSPPAHGNSPVSSSRSGASHRRIPGSIRPSPGMIPVRACGKPMSGKRRGPCSAPSRAWPSRRPGPGGLLRLRRHLHRQVPLHLGRHGVRQGRPARGNRRRPGAVRRSWMPAQYRRHPPAQGFCNEGPPRGRSSGRRFGDTRHWRARRMTLHQLRSASFIESADRALKDPELQANLSKLKGNFPSEAGKCPRIATRIRRTARRGRRHQESRAGSSRHLPCGIRECRAGHRR